MSLETFIAIAATGGEGLATFKAAQEESKQLKQQAALTGEETREESERIKEESEARAVKQKLGFLKSGLRLSGSALQAVDRTIREGRAFATSIERRGFAKRKLGRSQAKIVRGKGRAALFKSVGKATTAATPTAKA